MKQYDVLVVGAGFSGLYMLYRLRKLGLAALVVDAAGDVGGTWYWNRYPGARCDVESLSYSYSFDDDLQQEWEWKERYAPQPEILDYARHVADRFDLKRDIQFDTRVTAAHYDDETSRWIVETDKGEQISARYCIMATGCLSVPRVPDIPGLEDFSGQSFHTGLWPHEGVDFAGKRVGVIGTGSSAIQSIPEIARDAAHVTVFQRTAHYSIPAWNGPLDTAEQQAFKARYDHHRERMRNSDSGILYDTHDINLKGASEVPAEMREQQFEKRWQQGGFNFQNTFADLTRSQESNDLYAEFVHRKIRQMVDDPEVADILCPTAFPIGTKRLCVDTDYYATYNRDNVTLIDLAAAPEIEITASGVRLGECEHEFDIIVFATGFDAMTGALTNIDIVGRDGRSLRDDWAEGPRAFLGLAMAGFPNLFTVTGPGSPSVFTNMIVAIEQHVDWIADCLQFMQERNITVIEVEQHTQDEWSDHVRDVGDDTLYPKANSWYMGANVPGKPRAFLAYVGGHQHFAKVCSDVAENGYRGFLLGGAAETRRAV
jgi:cyclohexanone monooxygenase